MLQRQEEFLLFWSGLYHQTIPHQMLPNNSRNCLQIWRRRSAIAVRDFFRVFWCLQFACTHTLNHHFVSWLVRGYRKDLVASFRKQGMTNWIFCLCNGFSGWCGEQDDCWSVCRRCYRCLVAILHHCWCNQLFTIGM
jgi:hypothetical protein